MRGQAGEPEWQTLALGQTWSSHGAGASVETIRTAVVGVGYLGGFHAAKYATLPRSRLVAVVDTDRDRARAAGSHFEVPAFTDYRRLAGEVDAVSVAVPTALHYEVAEFFLRHKVHVLVEKPMAASAAEAAALINLARAAGCLLQVGHLERFNPAMQAARERLETPRFIEVHRLAPFRPRGTDVNVVLDLMIHDIDILLSMIDAPITDLQTTGVPVLTDSEDIANVRLQFGNGCVANLTASRVSRKTERKMRIFEHDAYYSIDFRERILSIYRRKPHVGPLPEGYDIDSEQLCFGESDVLLAQLDSFLDAICTGSAPVASGEDGLRALEVALRITAELRRGQPWRPAMRRVE